MANAKDSVSRKRRKKEIMKNKCRNEELDNEEKVCRKMTENGAKLVEQ